MGTIGEANKRCRRRCQKGCWRRCQRERHQETNQETSMKVGRPRDTAADQSPEYHDMWDDQRMETKSKRRKSHGHWLLPTLKPTLVTIYSSIVSFFSLFICLFLSLSIDFRDLKPINVMAFQIWNPLHRWVLIGTFFFH